MEINEIITCFRCPANKFRCSTGACLEKHLLCNGFKDCYEGDDESLQTCQNNK